MTQSVKPGTPETTKVKLEKMSRMDFSAFEKLGDAKINAANANFKLYAQNLLQTEQQKLFEQYKTDPINLANALGKLPDIISDLPEDIQTEMQSRLALSNMGLVKKAENNALLLQDAQNKYYADLDIKNIYETLGENYSVVMKNAMSPASEQELVGYDAYISQIAALQDLANTKDHNGKDIYSDAQKKAILNISDTQIEYAKKFIDAMIMNDDENLTNTKEYYQQFVLAPERFMKDNFMDRKTYDTFRAYVEKRMKQAGAEIKGMKFKQSIAQATSLQEKGDLPGTLEDLKKEGYIDKKIIDQIEKTNVKFNEIDPSKAETPDAFLNALMIITNQKYEPAPTTQEEQQKILEQGVVALDTVAEYAQKYGLSPENVQRLRETIVNIETNAAFEPILANFRDIIDNFDVALDVARKRSTSSGLWAVLGDLVNRTGLNDPVKARQVKELNDLLAVGTDNINQLIRQGDWEGVRAEQRRIQKQAALIKYPWVDVEKYNQNSDAEFTSPKGRVVKVKDFTFNGDILFETLN